MIYSALGGSAILTNDSIIRRRIFDIYYLLSVERIAYNVAVPATAKQFRNKLHPLPA